MKNKVKEYLFSEPDQDSSDMTVFYGWQIMVYIFMLLIIVVFFVNVVIK